MKKNNKKLNEKLPKEAYGLLKTSLKHQGKEFLDNSTLHGIRYLAEKDRPFFEKFMWFCLVSVGGTAAFVIIGSLWEKFQTNPTITGLDTDFHNQQVFFPTVTVCPENSFSPKLTNETVFEEFAKQDNEISEQFLPVLMALPSLSYGTFDKINEAISNISNLQEMQNKNLRQLALKVGIKCDELLDICKYKDEEITCCEYFLPLYSEHGLCYSFNSRYFSTEKNEIKNERINDLYETDKKWALQFVPTISSRIFVHSIDEVSGYDFRPSLEHTLGFSMSLLISMKQTYTTDEARQLTVAQRKCIFPDEKRLKYYKDDAYSFSQCMKQCRLERSHFFCQCLPPFYSPSVVANNYRHCGIEDFGCLAKHVKNITDIKACKHCELSCLNTVYDIEKFSKAYIPESKTRDEFHIKIEFLTWPIIRYKREVLFGWTDLLVSFGGIAGLFLGVSLLSIVEIFYYFTIRAGCMMYKNREELYAIQKEEETHLKSPYDLSLRLKFKESDRLKSLSLPNIQTVRPVESTGSSGSGIEMKAFDDPKEPIKHYYIDGRAGTVNKKIDDNNITLGLQRTSVQNVGGKQKHFITQPPRQIIFRPIQFAPYAHKIKPLDKKFHIRAHSEGPDIVFEGYLA